MVGTRSARKGPRPQGDAEEIEDEVDKSARQDPDSSGSDEDDAPEEFTLNTGKEVREPVARAGRSACLPAACKKLTLLRTIPL